MNMKRTTLAYCKNGKEVSFITKDDVQLNGIEYRAKDEHTLMLLFLGLGGNAKSKSIWYFAQALAKKGISLACYSSRGHGESKGLFFFEKNVRDIQELEKKYLALTKKDDIKLCIAGHSIGGRSIVCSDVQSDIILLNPTLYRGHPKYVSLPFFRRLYLLSWNYMVFRKFSLTHFGDVHFNKHVFKDLIKQMSNHDFSTEKRSSRCLLIISSQDVIARYNLLEIRDKVKHLLRSTHSRFYHKLILGLDHEFSDDHRTFMKTHKINTIVNTIHAFTRSD